MSDKPVIFISYSHKDRAELDYVYAHLKPAIGLGTVTAWDDNTLRIGDDWKGDINSAIDACRVFILLVTCHSLGSQFIQKVEIPRMLQRWQAKQLQFCPIVVKPCHMKGFWWLDAANRKPKDGMALYEYLDAPRDRQMAEIVSDVVEIVSDTGTVATSTSPAAVTVERPSSAYSVPMIVDYSHLPETPYKRLVGRDRELAELDEAWFDKQTNIVSLIAWGGAGKTSLVNEWLVRLQQEDYRDAEAVLGWSFYSQGTKERATSADIFLDWALDRLGITGIAASATAKSEALADALASQRILLVLDGLEPLQHGPGEQEGLLKDPGLRALLRGFAMTAPSTAHGLLVLTSRLEIRDIEKFRRSEARPGPSHVIDLSRLSDEAGAALLRDNGIKGTETQLREASLDFEGHALALSLLASFLARRFKGDIRQRDRIGPLMQKADMRGHGHARRVMQAYEDEWLKDEPILSAIMEMVGLFDRPVSAGCLEALRRKPVIEGLTNRIVDLSAGEWSDAIASLRDIRLLDPEDPSAPDALDAHPLVREWFGERLKEKNEKAWRETHGRLYEHLRDNTSEGEKPTLESLAPLYQAIAHGCRAGKHQEALNDVYVHRICRRVDGAFEFYSARKLGALSSDLAAVTWFFESAYETPVRTLSENAQSFILSLAAYFLRGQGRISEALPAERVALRLDEKAEDWTNGAICASNLSQAELQVGEISASLASASKSVEYADRSHDQFQMITKRAARAAVLQAIGETEEADALFIEAEKQQRESDGRYPFLYSVAGYRYCDLLLAKDEWIKAFESAHRILESEIESDPLLDRALVRLSLARACLRMTLADVSGPDLPSNFNDSPQALVTLLDEAIEGFRAAGKTDFLSPGLIARAAFRRSVGDWDGAARDLDEVEEIAEPGPMRLVLCDMALERARLAFAQVEAFAPLNGMLEKDNPAKPEVPSVARIAELKKEAGDQIKIADDYIQTCGYHRRDEELAELQAVLKGERTFASLPPRV